MEPPALGSRTENADRPLGVTPQPMRDAAERTESPGRYGTRTVRTPFYQPRRPRRWEGPCELGRRATRRRFPSRAADLASRHKTGYGRTRTWTSRRVEAPASRS